MNWVICYKARGGRGLAYGGYWPSRFACEFAILKLRLADWCHAVFEKRLKVPN